MSELENEVVEQQPAPDAEVPEVAETNEAPENNDEIRPSLGKRLLLGLKERCRKFIVSLKRKPQMIALAIILIASLLYLCFLGTFSQVVDVNKGIDYSGICIFANTLISILILPLFLNAFPKRRKPRIVYIVAVFVLLAVLIALDIVLYVNINQFFDSVPGGKLIKREPLYQKAFAEIIVHMVFVGLSVLAFAFLPLYKKGINKINTRKNLEENKLSEEIDTSAEV